MWPFSKKRRYRRYPINWQASLHCIFPSLREDLEVKVVEVSLRGARLNLEKLQVGPYHLVVGEQPDGLELLIPLPEGLVRTPVCIHWYNWEEEEQVFAVGVEFGKMEDMSKATLRQAIKSC